MKDDYIDFLQNYEKSKRGFTRVPNMKYDGNRKKKFTFGAVLNIGKFSYFAPVTSYNKSKSENICIPDMKDETKNISSVRFNYMFPVPKNLLKKVEISTIDDERYRRVVMHEYFYLKSKKEEVLLKAFGTYKKITEKTGSKNLIENSCDFKLLEEAYHKYLSKN